MSDKRELTQEDVARMAPEERPGFPSTPGEPGSDGVKPDWPQDAGAYIGHEPEMAAERLPEPLGAADERVAANSTQGTGVGRPEERGQSLGESSASPEDEGTDTDTPPAVDQYR